MTISYLLAGALSLSICAAAFAQGAPSTNTTDTGPQVSAAARKIHESALVVDTHADTPGRFTDENFDPANDAGKGHWDFAKVKTGNLGAQFFSIWVDPRKYQGKYAIRALDMIDSVYETARQHPDQMTMAYTVADIERAHQNRKLAALMGLEGGHAIENDIRLLRDFYRLGIRYMTLTWANTNEWADSSGDTHSTTVQHHNGLSDFGKQIVQEMNRLGMIVDISHVSDKTFYDTLELSKAPIMASHSSARTLTNHPRNMSDDMLKAIAAKGGVVQVNFNCGFIDEAYRLAYEDWDAKRQSAREAQQKQQQTPQAQPNPANPQQPQFDYAMGILENQTPNIPRPPFKSLIDHFDHIAKVAGVDHLGIGSDFDGVDCLPQGIDSVADMPKITQALLDRGYKAEDLRKILGGNALRVFREAERVSHEMQSAAAPAVK
jgi:membrane dipeptidase